VLFIMPAHQYNHLSDEDLGALVAYLQSVPPVDNQLPARALHPLVNVMGAAGMLGQLPAEMIDHDAPHAPTMAASTAPEYGEYLTYLSACRDCHGPDLTGLPAGAGDPNAPATPNITGAGDPGNWTTEQFINTLRTGNTPEGNQLNPEAMPWQEYGQMNDADLTAIHNYLLTLPAGE
jgi:mono/diheme cytochrome c family protein